MIEAELGEVLGWAADEGWNPGIHDAESFFSADPNGFFIAQDAHGKAVGAISAVAYDSRFGFIGLFIVKKAFRGLRVGIELGETALDYLGKRTVGQDGVLAKVRNYENYGFKLAYRNMRFEGRSGKTSGTGELTEISMVDFNELCSFDRLYFPADRGTFLKKWIFQPQSMGLVSISKKRVNGYGLIRKCRTGYKIAPLFAENADVADKLFAGLANFAEEGSPVFIDVPEPNSAAMELVKRQRMKEVFATARMYANGIPEVPINEIFGVTSFELG